MSRDPCGCSIALKDPKTLFRPSFVVQVPVPWGGGSSKRFACSRCGDQWEWSMKGGWCRAEKAPASGVTLPEVIAIPAAPRSRS